VPQRLELQARELVRQVLLEGPNVTCQKLLCEGVREGSVKMFRWPSRDCEDGTGSHLARPGSMMICYEYLPSSTKKKRLC
jgi:hypothetical protein